MNYNYYDSPEGEDCFKKLFYTSKIATMTGLGVSTFDILFYSKPQGYYQTAARYAHYTLPFIGMAAAFTATTCVASSLRHKDDKLNYFLGGCSAAAVLGTWQKSKAVGFIGCLVLGTAALLKKMSIEDGWQFVPQTNSRAYGSLRSVRQDWTITAERPKNWKVADTE